ncbi:unnamed protein product [Urochloa decumbens]|uniref:F-box domain-containing protein n=1 Tax=Urochloa decumbens TaxID=240449 RepID=A0ABC8YEI1_9POAL
MLLRTGKRLNRAPPGGGHDDDGLPLADEILLLIFAGLLDTDDLARCAATCRRWRRLVSSEASFICRSHPSRFVPAGFFHQGEEYGVRAVSRFVPLSPHTPRAAAAANALFAGEPFAVSGRSLAQAHAAAVVAGGAVFWRVRDAVLGLRLDGTPAEATLEPLPEDWATTRRDGGEGCAGGLLAVWPADGRLCLCVVEAGMTRTRYDSIVWEYDVEVQVLFREHGGGEDDGEKWDALHARSATVRLQAPSGSYGRITRVCLRGLCEKSGVVFLAAGFASHDPHWEALYAVDLVKMDARLVDGVPDIGSGASFHGYEMDRVEYLTALGKRRGKGKMTIDDDAEDIYDFC